MLCEIPLYGDASSHSLQFLTLSLYVSHVLDSVLNEDNPEEKFIISLTGLLNNASVFDVKYNSNKHDAFVRVYTILLKDIKIILDNKKSFPRYKKVISRMSLDKINEFFEAYSLLRFGIRAYNLDKYASIFDEDNSAIFTTVEDSTPLFKEAKSDIFRTLEGAARYAYLDFSLNILSSTIINFEEGYEVPNEKDLNVLINLYKEKLYKTIASYIKNNNLDLWDSLKNVNKNDYRKVMNAMYSLIKEKLNLNSDDIESLQSGYYDTLNGSDNEYFNAVVAFYLLNYFDDLLLQSLGRLISYNKSLKNTILSKDFLKYYFAEDGGHKVKNWNEDGDARTAEDSTSKYSKLILSCIPLDNSDLKIKNNVGVTKFSHTISKLFSSISKLNGEFRPNDIKGTTSLNRLYTYLLLFHENPTYYAPKIFEIICGEEGKNVITKSGASSEDAKLEADEYEGESIRTILKNKLDFTDTELAVLDAVYNYIFAFSPKDFSESDYKKFKYKKSARSLEIYNTRSNRALSRYSIVNDIAGVIDDLMDVTYREIGQYLGQETIYERDKSPYRDLSESFINTLNASIGYAPIEKYSLLPVQEITLTTTNSLKVILDSCTIDLSFDKKSLFTALDCKLGGDLENTLTKVINQLHEKNVRAAILGNTTESNTPDIKITHDILAFIDSVLKTNFLSEDGLLKLSIIKSQLKTTDWNKFLRDCIMFSAKGGYFLRLKALYLTPDKDTGNSPLDDGLSFKDFILEKFTVAEQAFKNNPQFYILLLDVGAYPKVAFNGITSSWIDKYLEAESILNHEEINSVSKNVEGNNDANCSVSFLGGNLRYYIAKYKVRSALIKAKLKEILDSYAKLIQYGSMTQELRKTIIEGLKTRTDVNSKNLAKNFDTIYPILTKEQLEDLQVKQTKLAYTLLDLATDSLFFTQKPKFLKKVVVDSGAKVNGVTKLCKNMNSLELIYHSIVHSFFGGIVHPLDKKLKGSAPKEIVILPTTYSDKTKFVLYVIDLGKEWQGKELLKLSSDELIEAFDETIGLSYRTTYQNTINLYKRILSGLTIGGKLITENSFNTADELNSILAQEIVLLDPITKEPIINPETQEVQTSKINEEILVNLAQSKGETILVDTHYRVSPDGIIFNELLQLNAEYLYGEPKKIKEKLKKELKIFIQNLKDSGCTFYVSKSATNTSDEEIKNNSLNNIMSKAIEHFYADNLLDYYTNWVHNGKLLISKEINGETILNPLLEKYFYLESLLANNLRLELTGSEIAHPNKYKVEESDENSNSSTIRGLAREWVESDHGITATNDSIIHDYVSGLESYTQMLNPLDKHVIITDFRIDKDLITKEFGDIFIYFDDLYEHLLEKSKEEVYSILKKLAEEQHKILVILKSDFLDIPIEFMEDDLLDPGSFDSVYTQNITLLDALYLGDSIKTGKFSTKNLGKWLRSPGLEKIAASILTKIENTALGTLLKRNVIIPGTLHYMHLGNLKGIPNKTKVAVMGDIPAHVWTFLSDKSKNGKSQDIDAHDGSALQNPIWTILENYSLGSLSVGEDMKPIWHHMDESTNSATLVKFAVFNMSNQRMIDSLQSPIELHKIMKKMTHIRWSEKHGDDITWNTKVDGKSVEIDLTRVSEVGLNLTRTLHMGFGMGTKNYFNNIIAKGNPICYRDVDGTIKQIIGFAKDEDGNYVTKELQVTVIQVGKSFVLRAASFAEPIIKKQIFNANGEYDLNGDHTIDSIYELWRAMGGFNSVSLNSDGLFETSERSNLAVVDFINNTTFRRDTSLATIEAYDNTFHSYALPLKDMMIGYVANKSAVKNGQGNVNSVSKWTNDESLSYMELDNAGLGILMDADHSIINAEMTEFSLVITALEAGGRKHDLTKYIYRTLGSIAETNVTIELKAVAEFLNSDNPTKALNEIYDIIGRVIIKSAVEKDARPDMATKIIELIEKDFNKHLDDHSKDKLKIPFSDPNIYSKILNGFINSVNKKSIKRQYPGSGCVMVPAYKIMQIYKIPTILGIMTYKFGDLWNLISRDEKLRAKYIDSTITDSVKIQKDAVAKYLTDIQEDLTLCPEITNLEEFIPSDVIDIYDSTGKSLVDYSNLKQVDGLNLDTFDKYYSFILNPTEYVKNLGINSEDIHFRLNVYLSRDLAPARISWSYKTENDEIRTTNIFASWFYKNLFRDGKFRGRADLNIVLALLDAIERGEFYLTEDDYKHKRVTKIIPNTLHNEAAEIIISDIYKRTFGTKLTSMADISLARHLAFNMNILEKSSSENYDIVLRSSDGEDTYVTFDKIYENDPKVEFIAYKNSELKLVTDTKFGTRELYTIDDDGRLLMKVGRDVLKKGWTYDTKTKLFRNSKGNVVSSKGLSYSKSEKSGKYEVWLRMFFITKYNVNVDYKVGNDTITKKVLMYKINTGQIKSALKSESSDALRRKIAGTLNLLFKLKSYISLEVANNLSKLSIITILDIFRTHLNSRTIKGLDPKFTSVIENYSKILGTYITAKDIIENTPENTTETTTENTTEDTTKDTIESDISEIVNNTNIIINELDLESIKKSLNAYYRSLAKDRYTSWQKALYFTVARIPAQDHLSFMLMKAVAFTGSEKNVCHVSHFLTFLLGSDYDIDKAYVMACEIGEDGRYVKYSDLFDYTDLDTLNASLELPIPELFRITAQATKQVYDAATNTFRKEHKDKYLFNDYHGDNVLYLDDFIEEYNKMLILLANNKLTLKYTAINRLKIVAKILKATYDILDKSNDHSGILYLIKDNKYSDIFEDLVNMIHIHCSTELGTNIYDKALKNYVSSSILLVIQSPRNMISAYTPIEMEDIRDTSEDKGALVLTMNLYNPITKWLMQVLNMTGKSVIGITAVGEKVFFNASFYWNELLRKGDPEDIKHLRFQLTFDRILNRRKYELGQGLLKTITCRKIANVNFEGCEKWISTFFDASDAIATLLLYNKRYLPLLEYIERENLNIEDLNQKTLDPPYSDLYKELVEEISSIENVKNLMNSGIPAGLLISLLLSAATDNAKELILDKINCDSNFAKCYLYLIMIGFNIKDIAEFMTSPAVNVVVNLLKFNMFDPYVNKLNLRDAIKLALGFIVSEQFIHGVHPEVKNDSEGYEYQTGKYESDTLNLWNKLLDNDDFMNVILANLPVLENGEVEVPKSLNTLMQTYILEICKDNTKKLNLLEIIPNLTIEELQYLDYTDSIFDKISLAVSKSGNYDDYEADLKEFEKVEELASETSNLGSVLGLNQGLPSDKISLLTFMAKVRGIVSSRERNFLKFKNCYSFGEFKQNDQGEYIIDEKTGEKIKNTDTKEALNEIILNIIDNNVVNDEDSASYLSSDEIAYIVKCAIYFGVLGKFDFNKWIKNSILKVDKPMIIGEEEFIPDEDISYQDFMKNYYNIIKGTFSIFHIIDNIPQFKSIKNLLLMEYIIDDELSIKSKIIDLALKKLLDKTGYLDNIQIKKLTSYVDNLIITDYFEHSTDYSAHPANYFEIPIDYKCQAFLDGKLRKFNNYLIDLSTLDGRASFKYLMERDILPKLQAEGWKGIQVADNYFILNLSIGYETNSGLSYIKTNLNLNNPNATASSTILYLKTIDGLINLSKIKVTDNLSLADLFILYNIITNLDRFGKDRLTALFRSFVSYVSDNALVDYYKYLGKSDLKNIRDPKNLLDINEDRLAEIGFDIVDAQIAIAPYIDKYHLYAAKGDYIITTNAIGLKVPHYRYFGSWEEYPAYPGLPKGTSLPNSELLAIRQYYTMVLPNRITQTVMYSNLKIADTDSRIIKEGTSDYRDLTLAIRLLVENGIIKYYKDCSLLRME